MIDYANDAAHHLVGPGEEDLAGRTLWRLVPGLRPSLESTLRGPRHGGGARRSMARDFELTYPESRTVRLYMVPFRAEGRGGDRRFAVILTDVTSEKRAAGQRIEDERTSSILLLAAGVAHELGNPLNSLTIHLQLIARKLKKLKRLGGLWPRWPNRSACAATRSSGWTASSGIFLEAIRPRPPDLREIQLPDVLAEVLRVQQREFADRGIAIEAETPASLPAVLADRDQLKQVFFNLTKNALEAMQPGGRLKIKSRADDESVYLLFGDSGSGIKQEDLLRLFQPYYTTKAGGHGLGLMIVAAHHAGPRRPGRHRKQGGDRHARHPPVSAQGSAGAHAGQRRATLIIFRRSPGRRAAPRSPPTIGLGFGLGAELQGHLHGQLGRR